MIKTYIWIWGGIGDGAYTLFIAGRNTEEEAREELLDWLMNDEFSNDIIKSDKVDEKFKKRVLEIRESQCQLLLGAPHIISREEEFQMIYHC